MKIESSPYQQDNKDYRFVATLKYHERSFTIHRESWLENGNTGTYSWAQHGNPVTVMCSIDLHELPVLISLLTRFKKFLILT